MSTSIQQCGNVQIKTNNGHVEIKGKVESVKINGNEVIENEVSSYENSLNKFSFGFFLGAVIMSFVHLYIQYIVG